MKTVYTVKRPFKYGGKQYQQGDTFDPTGGRYDDTIIKTNCTRQFVQDDEGATNTTRSVKHGK